jgi:predicted nucleic acid-binding Zn ribbon protein
MKNIRGLVEELFRNFDLDSISPRRKALAHWKKIAGDKLAGYCEEPSIDGRTVLVKVHSPAAAMELKYRSSEILSALNAEAGADVFFSLKVLLRPGVERDRKDNFDR